MKERFEGVAGRRVLLEVLAAQKLVGGNVALADAIAGIATIRELEPDETLIQQHSDDRDVFLILAGCVQILVNGQHVNVRHDGEHVGEMAAIEPSQLRSATVIARERSVVAALTAEGFGELGNRFPVMWRVVAKQLSRRLIERNGLVTQKHAEPRVFVMSSSEALPIANAIKQALSNDPVTVVVWSDGVFQASHYALEVLEAQVDQSDFGVVIAAPDDLTTSREVQRRTPRDNVIFELGFFMGRLGRRRTLLVESKDDQVKLPSDLAGLITLRYRWPTGSDIAELIAPTVVKLREVFSDLGPM